MEDRLALHTSSDWPSVLSACAEQWDNLHLVCVPTSTWNAPATTELRAENEAHAKAYEAHAQAYPSLVHPDPKAGGSTSVVPRSMSFHELP